MTESDSRIEVAVYYFPQWHPDPRNDQWHGKGWTEWELVKAARPRYPGHDQPKRPAWGYFDESDPNWAAREIGLAADHGVTCFLYDWYWYEGRPFLEGGLERGFLGAPNSHRLKFALMWANHDWQNIHPVAYRNRPETLATGRVDRTGFERLTDYVIAHYFARPNYLKIDGAPYFSIYEIGTFIHGLGGMKEARAAVEGFRAKTRAAGFPDLHLNSVVWEMAVLQSELKLSDPAQIIHDLGLASVGSYTWIHHYDPNADGFPRGSYAKAAAANIAAWAEQTKRFSVPFHINVTMGWDSSPRTVQSDVYENRGYPWIATLEGNTPAAFRDALQSAKAFVESGATTHRMVTINAWNEWTEGSYLLPDKKHGAAYLEAIKQVFGA